MQRGFMIWTAAATAVLTLVTIGVSVTTLPLSGPFCTEGCFDYPYLDIAARWPQDYVWMGLSAVLMVAVVMLTGLVHEAAPPARRAWSRLALVFAAMGASVLLAAYFVQLSVIQPSLVAGETDGIALLTQFNPHGIFIALEELGYLLLAASFTLMALAPEGRSAASRVVRWGFGPALPLSLAALIGISAAYGIGRAYLFEVAVIAIFWLCLLIGCVGLVLWFRRMGAQADEVGLTIGFSVRHE